MENPIKMDDLGVPLFLETPIDPNFLGHPNPTPSAPFLQALSCDLFVASFCANSLGSGFRFRGKIRWLEGENVLGDVGRLFRYETKYI